jgi:hypothetical protein
MKGTAMTRDRISALMRLMDEIKRPHGIYRRAVRTATAALPDSPENTAAMTCGNAALLELETAVREWIAKRPEANGAQTTSLRAEVARLTAELEATHTARLNEPILRHCLYPGCLHEFDMNATSCGREPSRPTWSAKGWVQVRQLDGHMCPDHAPIVGNLTGSGPHLPRWQHGADSAPSLLRCPCGWDSPPVRWRRYGTEAWRDHILAAEATTARSVPQRRATP